MTLTTMTFLRRGFDTFVDIKDVFLIVDDGQEQLLICGGFGLNIISIQLSHLFIL